MKNLTAIVLFQCLALSVPGQSAYWQQEVHYTIDVSLNDRDHSLDGFEKIDYVNHSPDTLRFIWFHLWPNAYKNDRTSFSDQLLENGNTRFYFSRDEERGYINRLDFKVNNITAATEDHPQHIDLLKLILPVPLAPGEKTTITTPFHVKLPFNFSRGGHDGQSYQATQWYPKPAVYDRDGWHPLPYLDQGEFYSEFGSFDVHITLPANYAVAATGELQDAREKEWLQNRAGFSWQPTVRKIKSKGGVIRTVRELFPPSASESKTLHYYQDSVHDFAWFADKRFIVQHDTCQLSSGRIVDVFAYYTPESRLLWQQATRFAKSGLRFYSEKLGEYPFRVVSVVQGPASFGGGMEYPTITAISPGGTARELDLTIAHEIGHNWLYGILGSNERAWPWMDEGVNTYYEQGYETKYRPAVKPGIMLQRLVLAKLDQPIATTADQFSETNYNEIAYRKTADWIRYLASLTGQERLDSAMHQYFRDWRFKHPRPADLKASLSLSTGGRTDSAFAFLGTDGLLPNEIPARGTSFVPAITGDAFRKSQAATRANMVLFTPWAFGVNAYDKFQWGPLFAGNLRKFGPRSSAFQFLAAPLYGFGSKKLVGTAFFNNSFYSRGFFRKIDLGIQASVFSTGQFADGSGESIFLRARKISPGLRLTLNEKNPRSNRVRYLQFRSFFFREDELRFFRDTLISGTDTTVRNRFAAEPSNRNLFQLKWVNENWRALYPYRVEGKLEAGSSFGRAELTASQFFNYARGGGLHARLFAGKFFYLGSKTFNKQFQTDRFHLNMTGANGYEDYTYSDYFAGRNEFSGWKSQQIMERDGAFHVRTDLLADKVGKTDNWLLALNLTSSFPPELDPLAFLPFGNPFRIFVDVGTYAEPWEKGSSLDRFIFDAGLQIPLLKQTINIYVPLLYSRVFRDYFQSTLPKKGRLFRLISFSIDLSHFNFRKFDRNFVD